MGGVGIPSHVEREARGYGGAGIEHDYVGAVTAEPGGQACTTTGARRCSR